MKRITIFKPKGSIVSSFPFVNFHGVFAPLHDGSYRGAISTNGLGRRKLLGKEDPASISLRATCSQTTITPDFSSVIIINPVRGKSELDPDELKTIQLLMKLLGEEWATVYTAMRTILSNKLDNSGVYHRLLLIQGIQVMASEVAGLDVATMRGYFELRPEDYDTSPREFSKLKKKDKKEGVYRPSGPITAHPTLGRKGSTVGWANRKGGY